MREREGRGKGEREREGRGREWSECWGFLRKGRGTLKEGGLSRDYGGGGGGVMRKGREEETGL